MSSLESNLIKRVAVTTAKNTNKAEPGRAYRGISTVMPDTANFRLYDLELIKQDIINHFHIRQGEKLEQPEFGTIIWDVLFEPLTDELKEAVAVNVTGIANYDPRVVVNQVTVDSYESGLQIELDLTYLPYNISESMRFRFDRDNGLIS